MLHGTLRQGGTDTPATMENVQAALAGNDFFWLDLDDKAMDGSVSNLLNDEFKFHHLAVQSAERFKQRPPIDRSKSNAVAASPPQPGLQHNEDYVDTVVLTSNQQGQAVYWCRKRSNLSYGATSESVEGQPIPGPIRALAAPMKPGGIAWDGEKASDRLVDPDTQAVDIQVPAFFRDGEAAGALVPPQKIASNNDGADGSTGQTAAPDESTADPVVLSEYGDDDAPEDAVADADEGDPGSGGAPAGAPPEPTAVA